MCTAWCETIIPARVRLLRAVLSPWLPGSLGPAAWPPLLRPPSRHGASAQPCRPASWPSGHSLPVGAMMGIVAIASHSPDRRLSLHRALFFLPRPRGVHSSERCLGTHGTFSPVSSARGQLPPQPGPGSHRLASSAHIPTRPLTFHLHPPYLLPQGKGSHTHSALQESVISAETHTQIRNVRSQL